MSIGRISPPKELFEELRTTFGIKTFVETGTFQGNTTFWASQVFEKVVTIEFSKEIFDATSAKYQSVANIEFLFGHSKDRLADVVAKLDGPAAFWLDAHWCGPTTYGIGDECPLLDEIAILNSSPHEHYLFIDDARLFLSAPPKPCVADQWPDIGSVICALNKSTSPPYVCVVADVIVSVPQSARDLVIAHCQTVNTKLWRNMTASRLHKAARHFGAYVLGR